MPRSASAVSIATQAQKRIYHVVSYESGTGRALPGSVPVEAATSAEAVSIVCGFKVAPCGPKVAAVSAIGLGDAPGRREYFRRA